MKLNHVMKVMGFVVALAMLLTACAPAATPTAAPEPTSPPEPTAVPFTAQKLEAPDCEYGGNLKVLETVDPMTVKFTFCAGDPSFLARIALSAFGIMDSDYLQSIGGDAAKANDNPVGTGPYMVKEWVRGDHITYEANPNYWGPAPKSKTFILRWSKEGAQRLLELKSGNVDGISDITTDDIVEVNKDPALQVAPRTVNNLLYLGVQTNTPPWDNETVRQALAMAIDKERLVKNFYAPGSMAAQQFVPPGVKPGFTDGLGWYDFDQAKAKQILTDAKFDFSKEYELYFADRTRPYNPFPAKIAQDLQAQLKEIGINIKLIQQEWATYLPNVRAGKAPLFILGWSEDYPDATNWYDVFLMGTNDSFGKAFDDIVAQIKIGASTGDVAVRQKAYDEVNNLVKQHVPMIPLAHGTPTLAFRADVTGVNLGPYNDNYPEMGTKTGVLTFLQGGEPPSLFCADETDGESFRACDVIYDRLYTFEYGSAKVIPDLAEKCEANADATVWTCTLRQNVKFSNGAALDSTDVFTTIAMIWDAKNPLHVGRVGDFQYWPDFFGGFLNPPPAK